MSDNHKLQYELVNNLLKAFDDAEILKYMIITGSWCTHFFRKGFK